MNRGERAIVMQMFEVWLFNARGRGVVMGNADGRCEPGCVLLILINAEAGVVPSLPPRLLS